MSKANKNMSSTVPIAKWLEINAGKQFPAEAHIFILNFALTPRCSHLGEDHTHEIKHDIHPEKWVHTDRFNIKQYGAGLYYGMSAFKQYMFDIDLLLWGDSLWTIHNGVFGAPNVCNGAPIDEITLSPFIAQKRLLFCNF